MPSRVSRGKERTMLPVTFLSERGFQAGYARRASTRRSAAASSRRSPRWRHRRHDRGSPPSVHGDEARPGYRAGSGPTCQGVAPTRPSPDRLIGPWWRSAPTGRAVGCPTLGGAIGAINMDAGNRPATVGDSRSGSRRDGAQSGLQPAHGRSRYTREPRCLPHTLAGSQRDPGFLHLGLGDRRASEPDGQAPSRCLTAQNPIPAALAQMVGHHRRPHRISADHSTRRYPYAAHPATTIRQPSGTLP